MKFSVIITAHNEGFMLARTIQSVLAATRQLETDFEIIIHLDNADAETRAIAEKYSKKGGLSAADRNQSSRSSLAADWRVLENHFGDVGAARNFAIQQAHGEYLFLIDGDDLISENYIVNILKVLENTQKEVVVSPEYCIEFSDTEKSGAILRMADSGSREYNAFMLFSVNLWIVAIAGRRTTFLDHPYIRSIDGYGHEDYALNIELAGANIKHLVAPETVYFYRRKQSSRQDQHNTSLRTQPYSELFNFREWQKMTCSKAEKNDHRSVSSTVKQIYVSLRQNKLIGGAITKVANASKKLAGQHLATAGLPKTVQDEWQKMVKLEPKVSPRGRKINALGRFGVNPYCPASEAYLQLCQQVKNFPKEVVLVDELATTDFNPTDHQGQAIIVLKSNTGQGVNHTCRQSDDKADVIDTSVSIDNSSSGAVIINYGDTAQKLSSEQQEKLLTRLLVQLKTSRLDVTNSKIGQKWLSAHQDLTNSWEVKKN